VTIIELLKLFGIPAAVLAAVIAGGKFMMAQIKGVRRGVQALLRAEMIDLYNHYCEKGHAPIYARENFENLWAQYHALGANGVMDDIRHRFLALPTEPEDKDA
ncbi:MAG: hypothetical protein IIZ83_00475, partial [Oscillospiraceae bacterium]|nr:hypothetical protein [Oscillospiraceae bacterium]